MADPTVQAEARRLRTLETTEAPAIRRAVVESLLRCGKAPVAAFYTVTRKGGRVMPCRDWTFLPRDPEHAMERMAQDFEAYASVGNVPTPHRQRPIERKAFVEYDALVPREELYRSRFYREVLRPAGLEDQQRMLAFDGPRFLGWVGLLRERGEPAFTEEDRKRLGPLVKVVRNALTVADRRMEAATPQEAGDLIVEPDGRVAAASRAGRAWLRRPGLPEQLTRHVRALEQARDEDELDVLDTRLERAGARLVRLDGDVGVRYLVTVRPEPPFEMTPLDRLPPSLRQTALQIARGLSDKDIARDRGMPLSTVRTYVARVYDRLEVHSRAELTRLVADCEPAAGAD